MAIISTINFGSMCPNYLKEAKLVAFDKQATNR